MGVSLLGRALSGRWSSIDGEGVRTRFFAVGVPLVPLETVYVFEDKKKQERTLAARRSLPSISIAYLRWVLGPVAVVATLVASGFVASGGPPILAPRAVAIVGVVVAWLSLVFLTGRAHGRAAAQRRLMKRYLGHAAAPELLAEAAARTELARLEEIWKAASSNDSPFVEGDKKRSWREAFPKEIRNSLVALYYALCRYDAAVTGDEVRANRARLAWERIERH